MQELSSLMNLSGAIAAFHFSDQGELLSHLIAPGAQMDETALDMLSHVCVANISLASMQARGWEGLTGMQGFYPIEGFTLIGMDWTAVVNGHRGVVLRNDQGDVEAAYSALAG
jgi:roadblock/LC7 domain-containing protein